MQKTLLVHDALNQAFELYISKRDKRADGEDFDKEKYRRFIFDMAKTTFGETLVYAESCAASYFFHIKEGDKTSIWETHLTESHREKSKGFTLLQYSFLNKDYVEPVAAPVVKKKSWFKKLFNF